MMAHSKEALNAYARNLASAEKQKRFNELYDHALIHFNFAESANLNARKQKFPAAFDMLLECPSFVSEFTIKNNTKLLPTLQTIRVRKSRLNGPIIDAGGFGWLGDPTEEALSKKFNKRYAGDYPLELLAYIDWDLLPPGGAWKAAADRAVERMDGSQFRRVWVYDANSKEVVYVYPNECDT